jgi:hypothetical protein
MHRDAKRVQFGLCDAAPGWGDEEDLVGWERLRRILDCLHWVGVAELEVDLSRLVECAPAFGSELLRLGTRVVLVA